MKKVDAELIKSRGFMPNISSSLQIYLLYKKLVLSFCPSAAWAKLLRWNVIKIPQFKWDVNRRVSIPKPSVAVVEMRLVASSQKHNKMVCLSRITKLALCRTYLMLEHLHFSCNSRRQRYTRPVEILAGLHSRIEWLRLAEVILLFVITKVRNIVFRSRHK